MPRKRVVTTTETLDDSPDLSSILKSLGSDGSWICKIYRRPRVGNDEWLCNRMPADVSEAALAEEYGPGKYMVRPWNETENKWGPGKIVNIAANAEGVYLPPAIDHGGNTAQMQMIQLQMQMQQQAAERQFQLMQGFNTSMVGILTAMITAQKPQDLASIVSIVKDMQPAAAAGGVGAQLGQLRDIVGLAKELAPASGSDDPAISLLTAIVPKFLERGGNGGPVMIRPKPNGAAKTAPIDTPAAAAPAPAVVPETPEETEQEKEMKERMRFLKQLKEKAAAHKDVEFWADYIDENGEEAGPAWILGVVRMYSWDVLFNGLCQLDKDLENEPYKSWFEKLYQALSAAPGGESE